MTAPVYLAAAGSLCLVAGLWGIWERARWRRLRRSRLGIHVVSDGRFLERFLAGLQQTYLVTSLGEQAYRAGLRVDPVHLFLGLMLSALTLSVLLYKLLPLGPGTSLALALTLTMVGTVRYLRSRQRQLEQAFDDHLAEVTRILADSLRAGRSVYQSLMDVPAKVRSPLVAGSFEILCRELQLNASLDAALTALTKRVRSRELRWLQTTLLTLHRVGGDVARVMDQMSHRLMERAQTRRDVLAASRKSRGASFLVIALGFGFVLAIGVIFPGVFAVFLTLPGGILLAAYSLVQLGIWKLTSWVTYYEG